MNPFLIAGSLIVGTVVFYLIFLGVGLGGISQNRRAQGIDEDSK